MRRAVSSERLVDRDLQRTLFVFQQRQSFAHVGDVALELHIALFGDFELLLQRAAVLDQRTVLRGFLRQPVLEFGDLGAVVGDFIGEFELRAFERAV